MVDDLLHLFSLQIENLLAMGINPYNNPIELYYSLNGMIQEANEALQEDTRWKHTVFHVHGYKDTVNMEAKLEELADVVIYWINACTYLDGDGFCNILPFLSDRPLFPRLSYLFSKKKEELSLNVNIPMVCDNPEYFYHSISSMIGLISSCLLLNNEAHDSIWNGELVSIKDQRSTRCYGNYLSSIFSEFISACLYSNISAEDMFEAVKKKILSNRIRFQLNIPYKEI